VGRLAATPQPWLWRRDWKKLLISLVAIALAVFVLDRSLPWLWNTAVVVFSGLVMISFIITSEHFGKTAPYRLRRLLSSAAPEAFFGDAGLYSDGVYFEWRTMSAYLVEASLDERSPRSLSFLFNRYVGGTSNATTEVRQNVLIPPGVDGDIAELQTKIRTVCPSARVAFV
jgi:hypothetical protein